MIAIVLKNFHMPQQHGLCKIVTWLDHYFLNKSCMYVYNCDYNHQIISSWIFCKISPWWHESGNWVIIDSGNGLLLLNLWHQVITWSNANFALIQPLETSFNEILFKIFIQENLNKCCCLQNGSHFVQASSCQHIEAETKWPPFRIWHFQMHFSKQKF